MLNRLDSTTQSPCYTSAQALSLTQKPKGNRLIKGTPAQLSNGFRLSDIRKVILGRHKGPCDDRVWSKRYFRAALPHIVADPGRIIAAKGSYLDAVRAWVVELTPLLTILDGGKWLEEQVTAYLAKPRRRCPRIDLTNKLLRIQDHEPKAYGLRSLSAMSRPKKVREAERAAKAAERSANNRAKVPGHKPRSESFARTKPWVAEGTTRTDWYAQRKQKREASSAEATPLDDFVCRDNEDLDEFVRNSGNGPCGPIRSQHLDTT